MKTRSIHSFVLFALSCILTSVRQTSAFCSSVREPGTYNIVSLVSFQGNVIPKEVARFHMKLRYITASQWKLKKSSKVGFVAYNICNNKDDLVRILLDILLGVNYNPTVYRYGNSYHTCCNWRKWDRYNNVIAVISYLPTHLTTEAARLLSVTKIPYFAYTQSLAYEWLPTHLRSYFPSFNIMSNEAHQVTKEIHHYGIDHVMLLLLGTSNGRMAKLYRNLLWTSLIAESTICVTSVELDAKNTTETDKVIRTIVNDRTIRMIIIWSSDTNRDIFIQKTGHILYNRIWYWYTEYVNEYFLSNLNISRFALETHFFKIHPAFAYQEMNEKLSYKTMERNVDRNAYRQILKDPWLLSYAIYYKIKAKKSQDMITSAIRTFDKVTSLSEENIESLLLPLWWSRPYVQLNQNPSVCCLHDRINEAAQFKILYMQADSNRIYRTCSVPRKIIWKHMTQKPQKCGKISCPAGMESLRIVYNITSTEIKYNWKCMSCMSGYFKSKTGTDSCEKCPELHFSNENNTGCYDPYTNHYTENSTLYAVIYFSLQSLYGLFALIAFAVFIKFRQTPIIRSSHFTSSLIQLTCHLTLAISLPFLFLGSPQVQKCMCQIFVSGTLSCIINAITLTKSQKLLFAFQAKLRLSKREVRLSKSVEIFAMIILIGLFTGILAIMKLQHFTIDVEVTLNHKELSRQFSCSNGEYLLVLFLYLLLITMVCLIQAFRARSLPKNFNETKKIMYCMFVSIIVYIVRFPVWYGQKQKTNLALVDMYVLSLVSGIQLFSMYSDKVYVVLFKPNQNTVAAFRKVALKHNEKKAKRYFKKSSTTSSV